MAEAQRNHAEDSEEGMRSRARALMGKFSPDQVTDLIKAKADWSEDKKVMAIKSAGTMLGLLSEFRKKGHLTNPNIWPNSGRSRNAFVDDQLQIIVWTQFVGERTVAEGENVTKTLEFKEFPESSPMTIPSSPHKFLEQLEKLSKPKENFGKLFADILADFGYATTIDDLIMLHGRSRSEYPHASSDAREWLRDYSDQIAMRILNKDIIAAPDAASLKAIRDKIIPPAPAVIFSTEAAMQFIQAFDARVVEVQRAKLATVGTDFAALSALKIETADLLNFGTLSSARDAVTEPFFREIEQLAEGVVEEKIENVRTIQDLEDVERDMTQFSFSAATMHRFDRLLSGRIAPILKKMPDTIRSIEQLGMFKNLMVRYGADIDPTMIRSMDARAVAYFTHHINGCRELSTLQAARDELSAFPLERNIKTKMLMHCAVKAEGMVTERARKARTIDELLSLRYETDSYFAGASLVVEHEVRDKAEEKIDKAVELLVKMSAPRMREQADLDALYGKILDFPFASDRRQATLGAYMRDRGATV